MSKSNQRILVAYATWNTEGQTVRIAEHLAETLRGAGALVDVIDCDAAPANLHVDAYDAALLGGSVRGGRYRRSLRRLVRTQRRALARTPWAFFSVCLTIASTQERDRAEARELPWRLLRAEHLEPSDVAVFAGALRFSRHGRLGGRVLFEIQRRYLDLTDMAHDWEYTDWGEVTAFVRRFLASLAAASAPAASSSLGDREGEHEKFLGGMGESATGSTNFCGP